MEKAPKAIKIPSEIDLELACSGDINTVWKGNTTTPAPGERITVAQAQYAQRVRGMEERGKKIPEISAN